MEKSTAELLLDESRSDRRGRRITSVARIAQLLRSYDDSGLTQAAFARREGMKRRAEGRRAEGVKAFFVMRRAEGVKAFFVIFKNESTAVFTYKTNKKQPDPLRLGPSAGWLPVWSKYQ